MRHENEMREAAGQGQDDRAASGRATWTCPDCGPLGYAVLLSGRGGLRGCPLCGGLAENDDTTAEDAGDDLPPGGGVHSRRRVRVRVPYPLTPEQAPGKTAEQFQAELAAWRAQR